MDLGLQGRSVLILASSKGLGKGIASAFCQEQARVMITSRDEENLRKAAAEIKAATNGEVNYHVCDITEPDQIAELIQKTVSLYGTIDVLVNNSGGPQAGSFDALNDDDWHFAFSLNLLSYVRAIRAVLPYMRKQNRGHIVNIASSSTKEPIDGLILSNTFRVGVLGLAKSLSRELAADNILINTVGPGRIATDRIAELDRKRSELLGVTSEEVRRQWESQIPVGRYGNVDELARMVVFLCSAANTYITGQCILVDGGLTKAL